MAKIKRTKKGWIVVHSITSRKLTGVFKSKKAALVRARQIRKRNM